MAVALLVAALGVHQAANPAGRARAADGGCDPTTGAAVAWGNNGSGQLGDGSLIDNGVPQAVRELSAGARSVTGGLDHTLAVEADGTVRGWGGNFFGQVGDGSAETLRTTPVVAAGLGSGSGVVAVAAGGTHSLALKSDGTVLAWGDNRKGQLGVGGAATTSRIPVQVSGLGPGSGVVAIAAGGDHSLAVTASGGVLAWGANGLGQLGDGATSDRNVPTPARLQPGTRVTSVDAGATHTAALTADGAVLTWGGNRNGELGDGTVDGVTAVESDATPPTNRQTAPVGTQFDKPLRVVVQTFDRRSVSGVTVTFRAPAAGPSGTFPGGVLSATTVTDDTGRATAPPFTANGIGGEYEVSVTTGRSETVNAAFLLNNRASGPLTVTAWAGTPQVVKAGTSLAPLHALVTDTAGRPASQVTVTFTAPTTGPRAAFQGPAPNSKQTAVTNARGMATATGLTTLDQQGVPFETGTYDIVASVAAVAEEVPDTAAFSVTNVADSPPLVSVTSGSGQVAPVGSAFASPLRATVRDGAGEPLPGVTATFTAPATGASGTFPGGSTAVAVTTDATGVATAPQLTANATHGTYQLGVTAPGASTVAFTLTNTEVPATLAVAVGDGQAARAGRRYASPLSVYATDADGRAVAGVTVRFTAPSSGPGASFGTAGTVATALTDDRGFAAAPGLVAGLEPGSVDVAASVDDDGPAVSFHLTVVPLVIPVVGLEAGAGAAAVAVGDRHNLVLKSDGTVVAWGGNDRGQLARPGGVASAVARPVGGLATTSRVAGVTAGARHSLVRHSDGSVLAWGANENGQLGNASTLDAAAPVAVGGLGPGSQVVALGAGVSHSLALRSQASATPVAGTPQRAFVGAAFVTPMQVVLRSPDGSPVANATVTFSAPTSGPSGWFPGGATTATALSDAGGVARAPTFTAGSSVGAFEVAATTAGVCSAGVFSLTNTTGSVAAGPCRAPVGAPLAWGFNGHGQLGDGTATDHTAPVEVPGIEAGVRAVAAGHDHTLALRPDGAVLAWGGNESGQLGNGERGQAASRRAPVSVVGLGPGSEVVDVAAGVNFSVALRSDGEVLAWGWNANGQLGNDSTADSSVPVRVAGFSAGSGVVDVAAGGRHVLALRSDGSVLAWGWNDRGQLGDGTSASRAHPVLIAVPGEVTDIAGGFQHSLARLADGSVHAWGDDAAGQLGDGTPGGLRATASSVAGLGSGAGVVAIAAGGTHNLVVTADGTVMAWGSNGQGELGDGSTVARPAPVAVDGLGAGSGVTNVAAGTSTPGHSLARKADGTVLAWGWNSQGQLGDGTNVTRTRPVPVTNLSRAGVVHVFAGDLHSLAVRSAPITTCAGTPQRTPVGTRFGAALQAMVRDLDGRPLPDVEVAFAAASSGASGLFVGSGTAAATARTNDDGVATAPILRANTVAGRHGVVATAAEGGDTATFFLTNVPGIPAAIVPAGGSPQQATVGTAFFNGLRARVTDAHANPLARVTVTFTAPAGGAGGTFAGSATATAVTGDDGAATAPSFRANAVAGPYSVVARVAGVAQVATFSLTNAPGPAAVMVALAGNGQTATVGTAFATRLGVLVTDADRNPIPGADVLFAAPAGGATGTFPGRSASVTVITGGDGTAVAPTLTANDLAGTYTVVASIGGRSPFVVFSLGNDATTQGPSPAAPPAAPSALGTTTPRPSAGYRLVASDGGVFAFGDARFFGSTGALKLNSPIVGMASTPSGAGYWLVGADGGIFAFGDARFFGSTGALKLNSPIVGMASTPSGAGYWLVGADGGIFAFGDARFRGSTGAIKLAKPVVGVSGTPTGAGYRLVAADGGIFAFGDARFLGSTGAINLAQPVVGISTTPSGAGYRLVAADGGIFAFGDARFLGSTGALKLAKPVVGMASTATGAGYWLVAADGGIFAFGDARFLGSTGALKLAQPAVAMSR